MRKLPKLIFVTKDRIDGKPFLLAAERVSDIPEDKEGSEIGLYELKETRTLAIERRLE